MAFNDSVISEPPLIHNMSRTTIDPVNIVSNGSYEYRTKRQRWERFQWDIPTQTMTETQKEDFRTYLAQRGNGLDSFKWVDPALRSMTDSKLEHSTGTFWKLTLPGVNSSTVGTHPVFKPNGAVSVSVNGGLYTSTGVVHSVDASGIPVITIPGTTGVETVLAQCDLYFVARLNSPWNEVLLGMDCNSSPIIHQVQTVQLLEVFGEY